MSRRTFIAGLAAASMIAVSSSAWAGDPIPGIDVSLGQVPGGIIVGTGKTDAQGNVTFANLPPGNYTVFITDTTQLKAPARVSMKLGDQAAVISEPIAPTAAPPAGANARKMNSQAPVVTKGGASLALVVQPDTTASAKDYNSSRSNVSKKPGLAKTGAAEETTTAQPGDPVDTTPTGRSYVSSRSNLSKKPGLANTGAPQTAPTPMTTITVNVSSDTPTVTKSR